MKQRALRVCGVGLLVASPWAGAATPLPDGLVLKGGYLQLHNTSAGTPAPGDCDQESEWGRMVFDDARNRLYVCGQSGWWFPGTTSTCNSDAFCTVFVSSLTFSGNLVSEAAMLGLGDFAGDGLGAGDAICNQLAQDAGLPGSYTAWLSDSTTNAKDRITNAVVPYQLLDGIQVADDFADILDCPASADCLDLPINKDEDGMLLIGEQSVWTGTKPDGILDSITCSDWTDDMGVDGQKGDWGFTSSGWTARGCGGDGCACELTKRLYCFQD